MEYVDTTQFRVKMAEYIKLTGKAISTALKEQAALLAKELVKNTYPKNASQGKTRVAIDIDKVFLKPVWFEEKFSFRNQKLGDRIKDAIKAKDEGDLGAVFSHSARLSQIRLEPFNEANHTKLRRDGRIKVPDPRSFPIRDQGKVKSYMTQRKKNVGTAKSGWAQAGAALGSSFPAWLNKAGAGGATDNSQRKSNPHIVLTNRVGYFSTMDSKAQIIARSLAGRNKAMIGSAKRQLEQAAKQAGFK